jgi:hypothetical protein
LRSVKPFLKENSTIPQLGDSANVQDMEEEELNSDPESLNGEMVNDPTKASSGTILITLFTSKPYNLWSLPWVLFVSPVDTERVADNFQLNRSLAKTPDVAAALLPFPDSQQAQPRYKVERSFAFIQKEWPGYDHVRTIGERKGQESLLDRTHSEARTWQLVPAPEVEYEWLASTSVVYVVVKRYFGNALFGPLIWPIYSLRWTTSEGSMKDAPLLYDFFRLPASQLWSNSKSS